MNEIFYYNSPVGVLEIDIKDSYLVGINKCNKSISNPTTKLGKEVKRQLDMYFSKELKEFDIPFKINGTEFQKEVYKELIKVKYGELDTYLGLAKKTRGKNHSRAVGNALNKNNISIVIPCHRIIGSNNELTGFGGGLDMKEYLINLEKNND